MKLSLKFLNRWENSIFKTYSESHQPISSFVATTVMYASGASVVSLFIMQMCNTQKSTQDTVVGSIIGIVFLITAYKVYRVIKNFRTIGSKIGFTAYILLLFGISTCIFVTLASIALMIVLALLAIWLVFSLIGSDSSSGGSGKKKKINVRYSDGTSEDMEEDGRGILGETYYKNKNSGNTYVD